MDEFAQPESEEDFERLYIFFINLIYFYMYFYFVYQNEQQK